ncbi:armadillo-type protein [Syncephalis plumigaleata]|nr:armadillo-type protein [Syncephalis plumigaleata]
MSATNMNRPEAIESMITGIGRYNPAHIPLLEEYLQDQCRESGSDLQANLALLKLYQLYADALKLDVVSTVLAKALVMAPEPDFNLCLYLLNDTIIADEKVSRLISLQHLVTEARYVEVWTELKNDELYQEAVSGVPDFDQALRQLIAGVIANVFQTIQKSALEKQLNLSGNELDEFITMQEWQTKDDTVIIPVNESNEAKSSVLTESLGFEQMNRILTRANAF